MPRIFSVFRARQIDNKHLFKWQPPKATEKRAADRAYRNGQEKLVFSHKLQCQDIV